MEPVTISPDDSWTRYVIKLEHAERTKKGIFSASNFTRLT
jgi:hypothetical protein